MLEATPTDMLQDTRRHRRFIGNSGRSTLCLLIVMAMHLASEARTPNRCVDAAGKVTFTDLICVSHTASNVAEAGVRAEGSEAKPLDPLAGQPASTYPTDSISSKKIYFGSDPREQIHGAIAILNRVAVAGSSCQRSLRIGSSAGDSCTAFEREIQPGSSVDQVTALVLKLVSNRAFVNENQSSFIRASQIQKEIRGYKEAMDKRRAP